MINISFELTHYVVKYWFAGGESESASFRKMLGNLFYSVVLKLSKFSGTPHKNEIKTLKNITSNIIFASII